MRIVVLGGYGEMGNVTVKDLVWTCKNCEIVVAGRDGGRARRYAGSFKRKNVRGASVDVRNRKALVRLLRGADVVIAAIQYKLNLEVMKACLEAGCSYVDLGGLYHMTKKQLKLHGRFKKKGLTAVLGCGATPGITNVLAGYGSRFLDRIDDIVITFAAYDWTDYKMPFVVPYSMYTVFDEFSERPAVFVNGRMRFAEPVSGVREFVFPKPIGKVTGFLTIHSELATFPSSFRNKGVKNCSFRVTFEEDFVRDVRFLIEMGLADKKPVDIGGAKVRPIDLTVEKLNRFIPKDDVRVRDLEYERVVLYGKKKGKRVRVTVDSVSKSNSRWNVSGGTVATAVPPSIAAQMIARGEIEKKGVYPPETCVDPKLFFSQLKRRGIVVKKSVSRSLA